ncbi:hypothetical protein HIM_05932 [Hirsutella minnesotensis 3608]|uniref:Invertebrate defensins family profile domain-containing protein n=1 Tax=Hirsutella minnesotensis 3608 TaxID=1043627 RepID=A0A0F7ZZP5_9HYPO|nr:hypothetical protein HIM_05932 [Hirsutella minnesotensis 3608]
MLVTQFIAAAFLTLGTVSALPQGNPEAAVEVRDTAGMDGDLVARAEAVEAARRKGCPKHYYRHNGGCCKFRHIRRKYYDCHPW